jgi:hypothetical protein
MSELSNGEGLVMAGIAVNTVEVGDRGWRPNALAKIVDEVRSIAAPTTRSTRQFADCGAEPGGSRDEGMR